MGKAIATHPFEQHCKQLPVPIIAVNESGIITYSNQSNADLFWVKLEDLIGKSIFPYLNGADMDLVKEELFNIFSKKKNISEMDVCILVNNKQPKWIKFTACFMYEQQSEVLVTIQDISGEKHALSLIQMKKKATEMIVKKQSLKDIFHFLAVHIEPFFRNVTYGSILLTDDKGEFISQVFAPNFPKDYNESLYGIKVGPRSGSCGTAIYRREIVISADIQSDPLWSEFRPLINKIGARAAWSVPIFSNDRVVGAFALYHMEESTPNSFEINLIETCAHLAGLAIEQSQTEEQIIIESQRSFRALLNSLPDLVVFIDGHGKWVEANERAIQTLALSSTDYKGKTCTQLSENNTSFYHRIEQFIMDSEINKDVIRTEISFQKEQRNPLDFEFTLVPILNSDGQRSGSVLLGRDITERKRMARLLLESERRFRSLFEHNPDAIYCMDLNGYFLNMNHQSKALLGYSKKEYSTSFDSFMHPDYLSLTKKAFQRAAEGSVQKYESVCIHKNGKNVDVHITNFPLIVKGEIKGVFGIVKDITTQKIVNEELIATKEHLESFVSNSSDCIKIFDLNGILLKVNPAFEKIYGYKPEEVIGQNFFLQKKESFRDVFEKIKAGEELIGIEVAEFTKDNRLIHISKTYSPIRDGKGKIVFISSICRDITLTKETEELLKRSDKLSVVGQLAAGVAHEIRNPLTSIKGFVQLFEDKINSEYVELMLSELKRIEDIVTEFLSLAKPQPTHFNEANLITIVQNTLSVIQTQAIMNQVELYSHFDDFLPILVCDQNKIKQLLLNILKNAIEAMHSGGEINLYIMKEKDQILLRIVDNGCGISEDRISKLGEPFFSNKEKGTGLGLMICYKIVEAHNGKMVFSSEDGKGTTVDIFLPH